MSRRLEELRALEARKKESRLLYEQALKTMKERFEETAHRLNLLLYMADCIEKMGHLPGNILYSAKFPQVVTSPFGIRDVGAKLRAATTFKPPTELHHITKTDEKDKLLEELQKKKELLLKMRAQARQEQ